MKAFSLIIHGGSGTLRREYISPEKEKAYLAALENALEAGVAILKKNGSALDAVENAVKSMEDCPLFNAGKGSVFTAEGKHEMDASIMEGKDLKAGAVALVTGIKNPVSLARDVMEKTKHVLLAGEGAMKFASQQNYAVANDSYFFDELRYKQWQDLAGSDKVQLDHSAKKDSKFGTVGAVAMDMLGNLAAATSTGGMTNKKPGRVGDSPIIGAGIYANNKTCAVSCTGTGEYFMRGVTAYDVSCLMEHKNLSLEEAASEVIYKRMSKLGGDGGLIAVDAKGNMTMPFNTEGMYRACQNSAGKKEIAIYGN